MSHPNPSTAMASAIVDEMYRNGVRLVVISPGSRSGALAIAAAAHRGLEVRVVIDERSAAFHALGHAKATSAPAAAVSTSGTAPANFLPAVIEAEMSCSPLIAISADRPAEMRGVGANQTIDQVDLFGRHVLVFSDLQAPEAGVDGNDTWRGEVSRAVSVARGSHGRPGPVHLNVAFREPLVPVADDGRVGAEPYPYDTDGRPDGATWENVPVEPLGPGGASVPGSSRGLIVAGDGAYDRSGLAEAARRLGWPILATATSGMRGLETIDSYHHLLAGSLPDRLVPDVVMALGAVGPSPRLETLIEKAAHRVRIDGWGRTFDPLRNATLLVQADPVAVLRAIDPRPEPSWSEMWASLAMRVRVAITERTMEEPSPTGGGVAARLNEAAWGALVAASSLPIREVDAHLTRSGPVVANRGASGIDGFVSTARGVASALDRVLALSGDLSLLHDGNGLIADATDDLVLLVLNNGGGGLFDTLPQRRHAPEYERLFFTPHHRDLGLFAALHGIGYVRGDGIDELADLVDSKIDAGGMWLIDVPVDREADLELKSDLDSVASHLVGELDP